MIEQKQDVQPSQAPAGYVQSFLWFLQDNPVIVFAFGVVFGMVLITSTVADTLNAIQWSSLCAGSVQ